MPPPPPTHRRFRRSAAIAAAAIGLIAILLAAALRFEPDFYREARAQNPTNRESQAQQFLARGLQLRNDIVNESRWIAAFPADEINAWIDAETSRPGVLPKGISQPRIAFETDRLLLACKVDEGPLSTIVWVVAQARAIGEAELELKIEHISAGLVPLPDTWARQRLEQLLKAADFNVNWRNDPTGPVCVVKPDIIAKSRDVVLEGFEIHNGVVRLSGRTNRHAQAARELEAKRRS
jgi:hypothetical protein